MYMHEVITQRKYILSTDDNYPLFLNLMQLTGNTLKSNYVYFAVTCEGESLIVFLKTYM